MYIFYTYTFRKIFYFFKIQLYFHTEKNPKILGAKNGIINDYPNCCYL